MFYETDTTYSSASGIPVNWNLSAFPVPLAKGVYSLARTPDYKALLENGLSSPDNIAVNLELRVLETGQSSSSVSYLPHSFKKNLLESPADSYAPEMEDTIVINLEIGSSYYTRLTIQGSDGPSTPAETQEAPQEPLSSQIDSAANDQTAAPSKDVSHKISSIPGYAVAPSATLLLMADGILTSYRAGIKKGQKII